MITEPRKCSEVATLTCITSWTDQNDGSKTARSQRLKKENELRKRERILHTLAMEHGAGSHDKRIHLQRETNMHGEPNRPHSPQVTLLATAAFFGTYGIWLSRNRAVLMRARFCASTERIQAPKDGVHTIAQSRHSPCRRTE